MQMDLLAIQMLYSYYTEPTEARTTLIFTLDNAYVLKLLFDSILCCQSNWGEMLKKLMQA